MAEGNLDWPELLKGENALFGAVLDEDKAHASDVRLTIIAAESDVTIASDPIKFGETPHPEVNGGRAISNALYLGFGPITYSKGTTIIKKYIRPSSKATLSLTIPREKEDLFSLILQLIEAFGTIGSRSRNGWGSIALSGRGFNRAPMNSFKTQPLTELVNGIKQYPAHLGADDKKLLCWEIKPQAKWELAMQSLAEIYLQIRTNINVAPQGLQQRHVLGYPVTNHTVEGWGGFTARMPSQLRLMVKRNPDNLLVGRILHLPHKLSKPWDNKLGTELEVWQKVHKLLDNNTMLHRCGGTR
ncbi:MAG: hypothetical protein JZU65_01105 [Chlorobium sp.]|nr:hypothetical protein [Chlorobium sp.]